MDKLKIPIPYAWRHCFWPIDSRFTDRKRSKNTDQSDAISVYHPLLAFISLSFLSSSLLFPFHHCLFVVILRSSD